MNEPLRPSSAERRPLGWTPAEVGKGTDPVTRAQREAFEGALRACRRGSLEQSVSLHNTIDQLVAPKASNPDMFVTERAVSLLQHVIAEVLPRLDAHEDVMSIAKAMLEEEIDRRRDVQSRLDTESNLK